jgi:uncharacterized membrane protein YhfC
MTLLTISFAISILIQLVLPIGLGVLIMRHYHTHWRPVLVGVLAYLVFQIVELPLFQTIGATDFYTTQIAPLPPVTGAILVGFVSAIIEQVIRTGGFWFVRNSIQSWGGGLTVTAGYAGIESVLIGFQFLLNLIAAISITSSGTQGLNLTPDEAANLQTQITSFWQLPWYLPLAAALQRVAVIMMQAALGMMVWLAISRKIWVWLGAGLAWQAAMNALTVILSASMPDLGNTVLYILIGVVNGAILIFLYQKTGAAQEVIPVPEKVRAKRKSDILK